MSFYLQHYYNPDPAIPLQGKVPEVHENSAILALFFICNP